MKKNKRDQAQERKLRHLTLSRETIQALDDPALYGIAGEGQFSKTLQTTTTVDGVNPCDP